MSHADAYNDCEWMDFDTLERFMVDTLMAEGVPKADATIAAEVLITSDKRGIDSHGIGRLKPIYIDRLRAGTQNPVTRIDIVKETDTTAVLDGNNGLGHVIAKTVNQMAIDIGHFLGLELFKSIAGAICRDLRNSQKAPGAERIYTAGGKEYLAWQYRKKHGCPIPPNLQRQMTELREQNNLDYTFPWD